MYGMFFFLKKNMACSLKKNHTNLLCFGASLVKKSLVVSRGVKKA